MVTLTFGDETVSTTLTGGRISISTNNPRCAGTATSPCVFTLNSLRLESLTPVAIAGVSFEEVIATTAGPAYNQVHTRLSPTPIRGLPFWVIGQMATGQRVSFFGEESSESLVTIHDLRMSPSESSIIITGRLTGTLEGQRAEIRFSATADRPFENRPPYLDPTAPGVVTAPDDCVASVDIDPGITDVDGDVLASWATLHELGIGAVSDPVLLPIGDHRITVFADDRYSAVGRAELHVGVVGDGDLGLPTDPGLELIELAIPSGTSLSSFALVAEENLTVLPAGPGSDGGKIIEPPQDEQPLEGAAVASLGQLVLGADTLTGDSWSDGDATLGDDVHVDGALHTGGETSLSDSVIIDDGHFDDGPFTPHETVRFVVPTASGASATDARIRPGETALLEPGAHGDVTVGPGSRLVLPHGMYSMRSLTVSPGAELVVSGDSLSPTMLRVEGAFAWRGEVKSASTTGPSLAVLLMTSGSVRIHSSFEGWILAPSAALTLLPRPAAFRGAILARALRILPNVVIERVPIDFDVPDEAQPACALSPRVTCVRHNQEGSFTAVFGYTSVLPHIGVVVPRGAVNRLFPPLDPSTDHQYFAPVGDDHAFEVTFTDEVRWILGGRSAVANRESVRCR